MFKRFSLIVFFVVLLLALPAFDARPALSAPGATPRATLAATVQPTEAATVAVDAVATATPEASDLAAEAKATAPVVILAPPVDVTPVPETLPTGSGYVSVLAAILIGVISAIAGSFVGGITILRFTINFLDRVNRDPVLLNTIEGLTKSVHVDVIKALNLGAQIVDKVTDGKPEPLPPDDIGVVMNPDGTVTFTPRLLLNRMPGKSEDAANKAEGQPLAEKGQAG